WMLRVNVASAVAGSAVVMGWMGAEMARRRGPRVRTGAAAGVAAFSLLLAATVFLMVEDRRQQGSGFRITNPAAPPENMEGEGAGPQSPFFPSSAQTNVGGTIPSNFFMTSQVCGRCHQEIYRQW